MRDFGSEVKYKMREDLVSREARDSFAILRSRGGPRNWSSIPNDQACRTIGIETRKSKTIIRLFQIDILTRALHFENSTILFTLLIIDCRIKQATDENYTNVPRQSIKVTKMSLILAHGFRPVKMLLRITTY